MLLLTSTYWLLYIVSLLQAITLCLFLPGMASSILFFWLQYQFILIEVVLFRSCGVSFLDSSTRGFIMACGFIIFLCINMHFILGTGLAIGRSPEAAMVAIVRSSPHTKIVVGVALTCTQSQNRFRGCEQRHCSICGCRHRFSDK